MLMSSYWKSDNMLNALCLLTDLIIATAFWDIIIIIIIIIIIPILQMKKMKHREIKECVKELHSWVVVELSFGPLPLIMMLYHLSL